MVKILPKLKGCFWLFSCFCIFVVLPMSSVEISCSRNVNYILMVKHSFRSFKKITQKVTLIIYNFFGTMHLYWTAFILFFRGGQFWSTNGLYSTVDENEWEQRDKEKTCSKCPGYTWTGDKCVEAMSAQRVQSWSKDWSRTCHQSCSILINCSWKIIENKCNSSWSKI